MNTCQEPADLWGGGCRGGFQTPFSQNLNVDIFFLFLANAHQPGGSCGGCWVTRQEENHTAVQTKHILWAETVLISSDMIGRYTGSTYGWGNVWLKGNQREFYQRTTAPTKGCFMFFTDQHLIICHIRTRLPMWALGFDHFFPHYLCVALRFLPAESKSENHRAPLPRPHPRWAQTKRNIVAGKYPG